MESLRKHLEIAFADAMYEGQYATAGLIVAALDAIKPPGSMAEVGGGDGQSSGNVVFFPGKVQELS